MNEKPALKKIGKRIDQTLREKGISRYRMALDLGLSEATVRNLCEGKNVTGKILIRAHMYLGLSEINL